MKIDIRIVLLILQILGLVCSVFLSAHYFNDGNRGGGMGWFVASMYGMSNIMDLLVKIRDDG